MYDKGTILRTCQRCGEDFLIPASRLSQGPALYCSMACYNAVRNGKPMQPFTCRVCSREYVQYATQTKGYCSNTCRATAQRNRQALICEHCSASFTRPASVQNAHWCSRACYYAAKEQAHIRDFWALVDRTDPDGCWPWLGTKHKAGYGVFGKPKMLAHRLAWSLDRGREIIDDLVVMHLCDRRECCQPKHLRAGRHADNIADKVKKGRHLLIAPPPSTSFQLDLIPDHAF
jgi:hypothetical protein